MIVTQPWPSGTEWAALAASALLDPVPDWAAAAHGIHRTMSSIYQKCQNQSALIHAIICTLLAPLLLWYQEVVLNWQKNLLRYPITAISIGTLFNTQIFECSLTHMSWQCAHHRCILWISFYLYFPVLVCRNAKPEPQLESFQTRNSGLEKVFQVWNPYWQANSNDINERLHSTGRQLYRHWGLTPDSLWHSYPCWCRAYVVNATSTLYVSLHIVQKCWW